MTGTGQVQSRDIIVLGASLGGVDALPAVARALPADLPAAVFVVLHGGQNSFEFRLAKQAHLDCRFAEDRELVEHGRIYLAPPQCNMTIERGRVRVEDSPREWFKRPSINALFRSAAQAYGRRVAGVLLSGMMEDGVAGLWQISRRGGVAIVQDPRDAHSAELPMAALAALQPHHCVPLSDIGPLLVDLATGAPRPSAGGSRPARLLIVEDERVVAADLEDQMRALGYEVCGNVAHAGAAIEAVASTLPDVVLMDIRLASGVDGTSAAQDIWEHWQVPVVYLTAYGDEDTLAAVKRSAAYGYVMKPYEPREVHVAIQLALDRYEREALP